MMPRALNSAIKPALPSKLPLKNGGLFQNIRVTTFEFAEGKFVFVGWIVED